MPSGSGSGHVSLVSAIPLASDSGSMELNSGALHRYLAESVWYPTALLPSKALHWSHTDGNRALATLSDAGQTVSLEFRFNEAGEVSGVYSPGRWQKVKGNFRQTPWEGRFRSYREVDGRWCLLLAKLDGTPMANGRWYGAAPLSRPPMSSWSETAFAIFSEESIMIAKLTDIPPMCRCYGGALLLLALLPCAGGAQSTSTRFINPKTLVKPTGYTHLVIAPDGRTVYIAGQVAFDSTGKVVGEGDFAAQAEQVFRNLQRALESVGGSMDDLVKTTTFITDIARLPALREVRMRHLDHARPPANTLLVISGLARPELLIEIEGVAVLRSIVRQ